MWSGSWSMALGILSHVPVEFGACLHDTLFEMQTFFLFPMGDMIDSCKLKSEEITWNSKWNGLCKLCGSFEKWQDPGYADAFENWYYLNGQNNVAVSDLPKCVSIFLFFSFLSFFFLWFTFICNRTKQHSFALWSMLCVCTCVPCFCESQRNHYP